MTQLEMDFPRFTRLAFIRDAQIGPIEIMEGKRVIKVTKGKIKPVAIAIDKHCDGGWGWPQIRLIAAELGWATSVVVRAIEAMKQEGLLITRSIRVGRSSRTEYLFVWSEWAILKTENRTGTNRSGPTKSTVVQPVHVPTGEVHVPTERLSRSHSDWFHVPTGGNRRGINTNLNPHRKGEAWAAVEKRLQSMGVGEWFDVAETAYGHGVTAEHVNGLIDHYHSKPGAWELGALVVRIRRAGPALPIDKGWMPINWTNVRKLRPASTVKPKPIAPSLSPEQQAIDTADTKALIAAYKRGEFSASQI